MVFSSAAAGPFECISRGTPLSGGRLTRKHEPSNSLAGVLFELRGKVLATSTLRVHRLTHVFMELAHGDRRVAMPFPPDLEHFGQHLSAAIAFLRLAHALGRILTAKS
jgi:hypothetical protein